MRRVARRTATAVVQMSTENIGRWLRNLRRCKTHECQHQEDDDKNPLHGTRPHFALFRSSARIGLNLRELVPALRDGIESVRTVSQHTASLVLGYFRFLPTGEGMCSRSLTFVIDMHHAEFLQLVAKG